MESLPVVLLALLAVVGAAAGVVLALSGGRTPSTQGGGEPGLLRITADVHTGWEQTLIGLSRGLGLPSSTEGLAYGALYLDTQNEQRLLVRSRSEIGRGFIGVIELRPGRRSTGVRYTIRRLPGDEQVRDRVLDLEVLMITALRRVDRDVEVQLIGGTLREFERQQVSAGEREGDVDDR